MYLLGDNYLYIGKWWTKKGLFFLFQPDQTGRLCAGRMPLPSETYTYDQVEGSHQKFSYMRVQIIRRVNSEQRKQSVSF